MNQKNQSNNVNTNKPVENDRKIPNEIEPPMQKPDHSDEDNDFTKGDKNDPLRKERIDRPSKSPVREEGEDDKQQHIHEPVAEEDGEGEMGDPESELADESVAKTTDATPKPL
ncbi:MAG: hypothetical protein ABIO46_15380 [Chitinophagales bacterium]